MAALPNMFRDLAQRGDHYVHGLSSSRKISRQMLMNPQRPKSTVEKILAHRVVEFLFLILICVNLVIVIVETDAVANGAKPPFWAEVGSWAILVVFVIEVGLRLIALKGHFWLDMLNVLDVFLVSIDLIMNIVALAAGDKIPISFLRIVRLCKITRLSKVFHLFPELRLLMAGFMGCLRSIFWGSVLLFMFVIIWSVLSVQFLNPLVKDLTKSGKFDDCGRCHRAYSSVFEAALTICQQVIAGDSWGFVNITVIEHYPESVIIYALVFMTIGLAILSLILGVIVDVASQAREALEKEIEQERLIASEYAHSKLLQLCRNLDTDDSGEISTDEIQVGFRENEEFQGVMDDLRVGEEDLYVLFNILDSDHSGSISYVEFVSKVRSMKTSDTQFMLAHIRHYVTLIRDELQQVIQEVHADVQLMKDSFQTNHEDVVDSTGGKRHVRKVEPVSNEEEVQNEIQTHHVTGVILRHVEKDSHIKLDLEDLRRSILPYPNALLEDMGTRFKNREIDALENHRGSQAYVDATVKVLERDMSDGKEGALASSDPEHLAKECEMLGRSVRNLTEILASACRAHLGGDHGHPSGILASGARNRVGGKRGTIILL